MTKVPLRAFFLTHFLFIVILYGIWLVGCHTSPKDDSSNQPPYQHGEEPGTAHEHLQGREHTGGKRTIDLLMKLAAQGDAGAQCELAHAYLVGDRVPKDSKEAEKWFTSAASLGNGHAQYHLATFRLSGINGKVDVGKGIGLLEKAAQENYAEAHVLLGSIYGSDNEMPYDLEKAYAHFDQAARMEDSEGAYQKGLALLHGWGVQEDKVEAWIWLKKAAQAGHKKAQYRMAHFEAFLFLHEREVLVPGLKEASEKGDPFSQYKLGTFYEQGLGVEESYSQAFHWYKLSERNGYSDAAKSLEELKRKMTADEVQKAEALFEQGKLP